MKNEGIDRNLLIVPQVSDAAYAGTETWVVGLRHGNSDTEIVSREPFPKNGQMLNNLHKSCITGAIVYQFDHEKLDVYRAAIELVVFIDKIVEHLPRGRAYLVDQLQRAATSVPLNIAEGAGEYASNEKMRFYRIAKRSATESAAILDVCLYLKLLEEKQYKKGKEILIRIVAMLTRMAQGSNAFHNPGLHAAERHEDQGNNQ